jgi:hypothetical protein
MELLSEHDFEELPEEVAHRWISLEKIVRARYLALSPTLDQGDTELLQQQFMSIIATLASKYQVEGVAISHESTVAKSFKKFLLAVEVARAGVLAQSTASYPFGRVTLRREVKTTILDLATKIEAQIHSWEISDVRKKALFQCIENLRREVNEPKTRVGSVLSNLAPIATHAFLVVASTTSMLADGPDAIATIQRLIGEAEIEATSPELKLLEEEKIRLLSPPVKQIADHSKSGEPQ